MSATCDFICLPLFLYTLFSVITRRMSSKRTSFQARAAKRRRPAGVLAPHPSSLQPSSSANRDPSPAPAGPSGSSSASRDDNAIPSPSGLGQLSPEVLHAITTAVTQALQSSSSSGPTIQFIPDPATTASQGVHHATDQQSPSLGATVQGSVDAVVQSVIGLQDPQGSQSKNTFLSAAIPLSHRVPDKLKNQIWTNEFIYFALLLHNSVTNPAEEQFTVKLDTSQEGQQSLVLVPSTKKHPLHTIDQWMSAFQIFVSIYAERVPQDTPALMKYGSIVKELATLGANWKFYDENFRKLRESQGVPWNQVHSELWLRSHSFRAKPNTQPRKSKIDSPFIPKGYCWKFHRSLHCPGCSFKHHCFRCGQSHPIAKCPQPKPHPGQRTKPSSPPVRSTPNTSQS